MAKRIPLDRLELMSPKELGMILFNEVNIEKYRLSYVKDLIAAGADLNTKDDGTSILHWAIYLHRCEVVELLIENHANLDIKNAYDRTPIFTSVSNGGCIKTLIVAGANIDARDIDGWTPLHCAVYVEHYEMVEILLASGSSRDIKNDEGDTPWDMAEPKIRKMIPQLNPNYNG